ncbi:cytochrome p450 domain-containing protein [Hirsutella rhossiliensis]|uniref:Cytochrome p450 domain-containing protein n=1 Tax=Hirsutella rhossiliensis TaxID=111463 RepID=A0A9P8N4G8_9HYPO|nr:cytochrome p450 domain-containing protein [Hirsutella rhossiliensis]KAH0966782.1 cytochrome p450 domain-containing protein [Hirsutella rhossiliensis]
MDVSAAVILNERLGCQLKDHPFASAMMSSMNWHYTAGLKSKWVRWSPLLRLLSWYNGHKMNKYISAVIDRHSAKDSVADTSCETLLDFTLAQHMKKEAVGPDFRPDDKYKKWLTIQLRLFMFTGHASSAPTISYCYYLLSQNPTAMAKLRAEHTQVYGPNPIDAAQRMCEQPLSLNQLPYTTAVIKETLRLFPPASSFRAGASGVDLYDRKGGRRFPTEGMHIWVIHSALHRDPSCWVDANAFIPERWLTLAMHSLKITMVMTVRLFGFQAMYGEVDGACSADGRVVKTLGGERAYPIGAGGSQPADGMPCKVVLRVLEE